MTRTKTTVVQNAQSVPTEALKKDKKAGKEVALKMDKKANAYW